MAGHPAIFMLKMKINTNRWNRIRYTLYTPIYDGVAGLFSGSRKSSIDQLNLKKGMKVLIPGAGTGLDISFLPKEVSIVATDLTPAMVNKLRKRASRLGLQVDAQVMDAQAMPLKDEHFDAVVLHLILAVIPDPVACIKEVERVLKPGGEVVIFDKFVSGNQQLSIWRKMLNPITNLLFSDITRNLEEIIRHSSLQLISKETADFRGTFWIVKLRKPLQ